MAVRGNDKVGDLTVDQFKNVMRSISFSRGGTGDAINIDSNSTDRATNNAQTLTERLKEAKDIVAGISGQYYSLSENQEKSFESINKAINESHKYAKDLANAMLDSIDGSKSINEHNLAAVGFMEDIAERLADQASAESRLKELQSIRLDYIAKRAAGELEQNETFEKRIEEEIRLAKLQSDREELQSGILGDLKSELGLVGKLGETFAKYGMYTALAAMAGMVAKELFKAAKAGFDLAKSSGASVEQSMKYASNIAGAQLSMTGLLFGSDAVVQSAEALAKEFGDVSAATSESIKSVTRLAAMTGDAASAVKLNKMFMAISDGTQDGADNMKNMVIETSKLNGVIPEKVMKDLAQYSHEFQVNGGKSAEQMAKTLITVNKLGLSFGGLLKTKEALYDIEGSLERQMKAQVLSGKQLHIQEAQRLAMNKDYENLAKLIVSDLGDINEFQNESEFSQNAIAAAYGMTREEVVNMLNEEARVQTIREEGLLSMNGMKAAMVGVVGTTTSMAGKVGDVATKFNDAGINVSEMGGKILKKVIPKLTKMIGLQKLSNRLSSMGSRTMGSVGAGASGMGAGLGAAVGPILLFTAAAIGLGFALKLAAPAIEAIGKAIGTIITSIGDAISTIIGGIGDFVVKISEVASVDLAAGLLATAAGFMALTGSLYLFAGAGILAIPAMTAVGLSMIGFGFALKLAAPRIESVGSAIEKVAVSIGDAISTIGGIGDFVVKISEVASVDLAAGLLATADGFMALTGSLYLFAGAGILAIPAMTAVGAFVTAMSILSSVTGMGSNENKSDNESDNELINEIKALRNDIRSQPIVIKVNDKVVSEITRVQNVQSSYRT